MPIFSADTVMKTIVNDIQFSSFHVPLKDVADDIKHEEVAWMRVVFGS